MNHTRENDDVRDGLGRRAFLRRAGLIAGASAVLPLLGAAGYPLASAAGSAAHPAAPGDDPDQLFQSGEFAAAGRGYARLLRDDPGDAHAAGQLGYIALLSNRFARAEHYLSEAHGLAPDDTNIKRRLADCFVRQDMFARAVPLLPPAPAAQAAQLAEMNGRPYELHGAQATRVPFLDIDPLPQVKASVNGRTPGTFVLDTGAMGLTLTTDAAEEAGLSAVSSMTANINGRAVTTFLGVAPSLRLGEIELRNVPVSWTDGSIMAFPNGVVTAGTIGTALFYHFLTTIDYQGRALVLRRKTSAQQRAFRAEAARAALRPQPLWLAGDHLPCTLGKLNDYGPRMVVMDTGGISNGLNTTAANAERAGITIDWDHPILVNGGTTTIYPIAPDRISIGDAVGRHLPGSAGPTPWEGQTGFDLIGNFTHEFFKPFAVTFDYVGMNLFIG
ncbi:aspartyl protease family protein [Streptomyces cocklensis]|uniref:TPR_REGION domain-containing protein n=1 Tax=Actinacidiphila cocklensis TaxID=887465 RepID=A0A9W4GS81_9ACTN|nr:aspartyl protease family protein [Actinacidiphila cocklensis]MDD1057195.1 aspartyl protease family protein [Actinacidiphila cocklensis]CAG6395059.1 TPR_REGION domain-containing protein [Actinacidiphila cocklensis]